MKFRDLLVDSAPFAIRTLWVCLIVGPTTWVIFSSGKSFLPGSSIELAAWVQAFGSIGAIVGAIFISRQQYQRDAKRLEEERQSQSVKLAGIAAWSVESMHQTILHLEMHDAGFHNYQRHLDMLDETAAVLRSVDINSIRDIELAMKWTQLGQFLADLIREGRKDDSIMKVRMLRLPHMRRSHERAQEAERVIMASADR
ncbi:hypothetical protein [Pseudomonas syringae]|uniref:hypothetical protein n=1 Tax=Pseudomonas syringae TaxID=317 RepID=UPI0007EE636C|nr:hypothetical protein [Pseudomonas syringae]OBS35910.1 hypothetical protein A9K81_05825 [Pseudomonas syringae pv. syringae]